jgi:ParB-like chromosome segregation protein Spo0J
LEHLSEAQARAFMIADNRLTETSSWDDRALAEQLKALSELNLDFSLDAIGFEMGEIDLRIESLHAERKLSEDPADALPAPGPRVSEKGDLWLLERHRVLCGDALEEADYKRLLVEERAGLVFVDPPYNVRIEGNVSGLGAVRPSRLHHGCRRDGRA